ncbi:MAG: CaiB/BaiF CoA-transferase family protein, partial [Armatimonadota bacterium]|nr:CaiB/BaiF CoA-transferase family protein [Armatimonadota bacterium]
GRSLWWPVIARGKKSVTVDLRHPDGQELVRRLADRCDVLVENFRPGTLEGWGLGPDVLLERNPALVYVRISAFGQAGPYRDRPGFGAVAEAMGGLRYLVGYPDRPPPRFGISIGDTLAGMFGALGALLALREREVRGGRGQVVDVAITDAVLAVLESVIAECSVTGAVRERSGTVLPGVAPSNLYETADGRWVVVAANADGVFRRLCDAMGRPEWKADPRYATHEARGAHQAELDQAIAQWVRSLPAEELLGVLDRHGVPCGPVYNAAEVLADPHYRARGALVEVDNPGVGRVTMQGPVPRLAETPLPVPGPAPELGEHTDHVLKELLGLSAEDVARLREAGVV